MAKSSTSFPNRWRSGKTTVIRVPERWAEQLLAIAERLDESASCVVRDEPGELVLHLASSVAAQTDREQPVNVASVPQRSPFRYPGGKTWLVPYVRAWLRSIHPQCSRLIEPFAGGAIVSLTTGFERLARHVTFAERDDGVAAVWRVVLNGQADWLAKRIRSFELTLEHVREVLDHPAASLREEAFKTLLRNRVQRGGIMAKGAGLVKTGETGRGLNARWYPETLARRIKEINTIKDRFSFVHGDGLPLVGEHLEDVDCAFYVDPPYLLAAKRLYTHWQVDHRGIFELMSKAKGHFLMSYDNTPEIRGLADEFGFQTRQIAMKNTHHAKMTELLIGRRFEWLDHQA